MLKISKIIQNLPWAIVSVAKWRRQQRQIDDMQIRQGSLQYRVDELSQQKRQGLAAISDAQEALVLARQKLLGISDKSNFQRLDRFDGGQNAESQKA